MHGLAVQESVLSLEEAREITGSLSDTSKMPGYSYSIPADMCKVGGLLRNIKGSACENCYCYERGHYCQNNVAVAQQHRFAALFDPLWVPAMVTMLRAHVAIGVPYFRWHDAGDLQGPWHLEKICEIARQLPAVHFWLPTQERPMVRKAKRTRSIPKNLLIRASAPMVGGRPPAGFAHSSSISPKANGLMWKQLIESNTQNRWHCPAPLLDHKCGDCRACWNPEVKHVVYLEF